MQRSAGRVGSDAISRRVGDDRRIRSRSISSGEMCRCPRPPRRDSPAIDRACPAAPPRRRAATRSRRRGTRHHQCRHLDAWQELADAGALQHHRSHGVQHALAVGIAQRRLDDRACSGWAAIDSAPSRAVEELVHDEARSARLNRYIPTSGQAMVSFSAQRALHRRADGGQRPFRPWPSPAARRMPIWPPQALPTQSTGSVRPRRSSACSAADDNSSNVKSRRDRPRSCRATVRRWCTPCGRGQLVLADRPP